ncbi:MAG: hypothetical protein K0Q68_2520 [Moraxellaceae bacterium]|nr:hypothetical protein [Moraxellaceae bacterium]
MLRQVCTGILLLALSPLLQALEISPYTASYRFNLDNKLSGSATRTLDPLGYQQQRSILFSKKKAAIRFDWQQRKGTGTRDDKPAVSFPLTAGTLDALNMEIQLRRDLKDLGRLGGPYALATPKELSPLAFVIEGNEVLTTPMGKLNTLRVSRKHHDPTRRTVFWLARDHNFLPAKVIQDDGSAHYELELTGIKFTR